MKWGSPFDPDNDDGIFTTTTVASRFGWESALLGIHDSGTRVSIIDEDIATHLGFDKSQSIGKIMFDTIGGPIEGYRIRVPRFAAFGRTIEPFALACIPLSNKLGIEVLVGRDFFRGLRCLLDEMDGRVVLTDEKIPLP